MCGIVGFNWEDRSLIKKMADSIKHRGPDGYGYYIDKNVSLGHRRLAIIDLSKKGKQPMSDNEGNTWITFNGEIYNYKELKTKLESKGHRFKSNSDTEVIIYAYKEYGKGVVSLLRGMFAFAIYNSKENSLLLARDPLGIKPLYYYFNGKNIIFASEIKAILEADIARKVNKKAVYKYLAYRYTPDEETLFTNIKKVLPGETLELRNNKVIITKYYNQSETIKRTSLNKATENLRKVLENSVRAHLIADVEVGSFLSGGIDSSVISAIAQNLIKENKGTLKTFSVYYDHFSEKEYSDRVAEYIGTEHITKFITRKEAIKLIPKIISCYDEPMTDFASIPYYVLSEFAKEKVKTVIAGQGGDEIFGGYEHYAKMQRRMKISKMVPIRLPYKNITNNKFETIIKKIMINKDTKEAYLDAYSVFKKEELMGYINKEDLIKPIKNLNPDSFRQILNKILYIDQKLLVGEYFNMVADKMTMANSLEKRVPYLDVKIVNFSYSLPIKFKVNGNKEKIILKKVGSTLLPKEIINRKKQGHGTPYFKWIKEEIGDKIISEMENPNIVKNKILTKEFVDKNISKVKDSQAYAMRGWMLYSLEKWYNLNFKPE